MIEITFRQTSATTADMEKAIGKATLSPEAIAMHAAMRSVCYRGAHDLVGQRHAVIFALPDQFHVLVSQSCVWV